MSDDASTLAYVGLMMFAGVVSSFLGESPSKRKRMWQGSIAALAAMEAVCAVAAAGTGSLSSLWESQAFQALLTAGFFWFGGLALAGVLYQPDEPEASGQVGPESLEDPEGD